MANLYDYLEEYGGETFASFPPNEIDNLIFSQLSYLSFSDVVPKDRDLSLLRAKKAFFAKNPSLSSLGLIVPKQIIQLLRVITDYPRYKKVRVSHVVELSSKDLQFGACLFTLPTGDRFVAYRGTDDQVVGWKEDFMLCYEREIPAQKEAVEYLKTIIRTTEGKLYLCGHSKGGNLAVYAAVKCRKLFRGRLVAVYNDDGPGFIDAFYNSDSYRAVKGRVHAFVPKSSVIGMLLEHSEDYTVVESKAVGIFQHDAFSWQVEGDHFKVVDDRTRMSYFMDESVKGMIARLTLDQRKKFVDAFFKILELCDVEHCIDIPKNLGKIIQQTINLDDELKETLLLVVKALFASGREVFFNMIKAPSS